MKKTVRHRIPVFPWYYKILAIGRYTPEMGK